MTDTIYFIAPTPAFLSRTLTGAPNVNGTVTTYQAGTIIPKATYTNSSGNVPNTNPVQLDGSGEAVIYWASDTLYKIIEKDSDGVIIRTTDNYPVVGTTVSPTPVTVTTLENIVRNPQFTFWTNTFLYTGFSSSANNYDYVADDWLFARSNLNATINFERKTFSLGQDDVPGNPTYYLRYNCANSGASGETYKYLYQNYSSVTTLSEQKVTIAFYAKSDTANLQLSVNLAQFFGTGGSPSATLTNVVGNFNLSQSWQQYSGTATLQDLAPYVIGSNGDDALQLRFNLQLNTAGVVDLCNVQLQIADQVNPFPFESVNDQFKRLDDTITNGVWKTSDVKLTIRNSANQPDPGWLYMNDGTIGDPTSGSTIAANYTKNLYKIIWENVNSSIWAPIFNSDGTFGTYGVSAELDYNAHKRLSLTKALGRSLAGVGQSVIVKRFVADHTTDTLAVDDASSFLTGAIVLPSVTGGVLPTGISATPYYALYVDSTHIQLCTSLANLTSDPPVIVTFSDNGSGTLLLTTTLDNKVAGQYQGEFTHLQTRGEVGVHKHGAGTYQAVLQLNQPGTSQDLGPTGNATPTVTINMPLTGSSADSAVNTAMNIVQPTTFYNVMIKL